MTAPSPPVTVVVPTHNRPEPMRRAVQSVLDQTYPGDVEVLVVFDACDPVLPDVVVPAHRTVRALENARSRGPSGGRNTGAVAATGDYVAFLDDDDWWLPTKLEAQVELLERHPEAPLAATAMVVDDGERTHVRLAPSESVAHAALVSDRLACLHTSSFLARRSSLEGDLGLFDEEIPASYGEDYDLLLRASAIAPIPVLNEPLVGVAWQGQSYFLGRWLDYAESWLFMLDKHPDFRTDPKDLARIEAYVGFAYAAGGRRRDGARWAFRSLRKDWRGARAWLALAMAARLLGVRRIVALARRVGKGV